MMLPANTGDSSHRTGPWVAQPHRFVAVSIQSAAAEETGSYRIGGRGEFSYLAQCPVPRIERPYLALE